MRINLKNNSNVFVCEKNTIWLCHEKKTSSRRYDKVRLSIFGVTFIWTEENRMTKGLRSQAVYNYEMIKNIFLG